MYDSILTNFNENYYTLDNDEKIKFYRSFFYPALFVILLWLIKGADIIFDLELYRYGLYPLQAKGLIGIFTAPFLSIVFSIVSLSIVSVKGKTYSGIMWEIAYSELS